MELSFDFRGTSDFPWELRAASMVLPWYFYKFDRCFRGTMQHAAVDFFFSSQPHIL